jgi:hypothetical protein
MRTKQLPLQAIDPKALVSAWIKAYCWFLVARCRRLLSSGDSTATNLTTPRWGVPPLRRTILLVLAEKVVVGSVRDKR